MPVEGSVRDGRETSFHLIETMRREPEAGLVRLDLHLARLEHSAHSLGFVFDHDLLDAAITALPLAATAQRVRLLLHRDGTAAAEAFPFTAMEDGAVWRLRLARQKLASTDTLLRHKTSRRTAYEIARSEYTVADADEVLLGNEKGEACEGTIATLFADFGGDVLVTPALECGLLAGVLRTQMLAEGKAREAVVQLEELGQARRLFVGNSLRGLIPASLKRDR